MRRRTLIFCAMGLLVPALLWPLLQTGASPAATLAQAAETAPLRSSYIVQSTSAVAAQRVVEQAGGKVTATLNIINAVGAELDSAQVTWLRNQSDDIRVYDDGTLEVSGEVKDTHYQTLVGADVLHKQGVTGEGVTIAVLDTGLWKAPSIEFGANGAPRILAQYDALPGGSFAADDCGDDDEDEDEDEYENDSDCGSVSNPAYMDIDDWNGHGTHITSIMVSSDKVKDGRYQGIAPDAGIVAVRAFEPDGSGTYLNVIKALDWIVSHRAQYQIRILNLSFGARAASHYWDDPVNQAVMAAWKRGIVVVTAAGNSGPGPMTVGVPANVPYVITVGAMTDNFTPSDRTDDRLARFSAAGPTVEGFVKPDVVAPGGHMLGKMPPYAWLPLAYPDFVQADGDYFSMSGTSQSAAVVSGVLALMLQAEPSLPPDDAKCRLMVSARFAIRDDGSAAYSVFQQGAGMVDAVGAVNETARGCANREMSALLDLWGLAHYAGPAGVDETGTYYLVDENGKRQTGDGLDWSNGALWPEGSLWQQGVLWNQGLPWSSGVHWNDTHLLNPDSLLNQGALWPEGSLWPEGLSRSASTLTWVDFE